jgi:hypothetical protein
MSITFSSCFYVLKTKFSTDTYISWMNNFISIVNEFNLVIYTNENSVKHIDTKENPKIKIIIKPLEQFNTYKYKNDWIRNHENNTTMNDRIVWQVNMLWNEKIWFVNETCKNKYFDTPYYGWCDIGYFRLPSRNGTCDLSRWANSDKISKLTIDKVYYGLVENNIEHIRAMVSNKNSIGLPIQPIPPGQVSIAGGFFIVHRSKIDWWLETFYKKLELYLHNNYLVKDDQMIVIDCILTQPDEFILCQEHDPRYDNWFMFQRILQ